MKSRVLPLKVSASLMSLIILSSFLFFQNKFDIHYILYFYLVFSIQLLIVGNQWRFNYIAEHETLRKVMIFLPSLSLSLNMLWGNKIVQLNINNAIYLTIAILLVLVYQIRENWMFLKFPDLAASIFPSFSKTNFWNHILQSQGSAIAEELLFRAIPFLYFSDNILAFIIFSSTMFVIWHLLFPWSLYTQPRKKTFNQIFFSIVFCILLLITDSIFASIILHMIFNLGSCFKYSYLFRGNA